MLVDQHTESVIVPLNNLSQTNKLELANSSLSEMAVLGVSRPTPFAVTASSDA